MFYWLLAAPGSCTRPIISLVLAPQFAISMLVLTADFSLIVYEFELIGVYEQDYVHQFTTIVFHKHIFFINVIVIRLGSEIRITDLSVK